MANKRFLEQATHFREIYMRAETAHKQKERLEEELRDAIANVTELKGASACVYSRFREIGAFAWRACTHAGTHRRVGGGAPGQTHELQCPHRTAEALEARARGEGARQARGP
jgi:hypothetical protein